MNTVDNVYAFSLQVRPLRDLPAPVLPDELLEALADYYQENRLACGFYWFCRMPERFGFVRPVRGAVDVDDKRRLLCRQRRVYAFLRACEFARR